MQKNINFKINKSRTNVKDERIIIIININIILINH